MSSGHRRRRTGATDFVAPGAAHVKCIRDCSASPWRSLCYAGVSREAANGQTGRLPWTLSRSREGEATKYECRERRGEPGQSRTHLTCVRAGERVQRVLLHPGLHAGATTFAVRNSIFRNYSEVPKFIADY